MVVGIGSAVTGGGEVVSRGRTCEERLKVVDKRTI